MSVCIAWTDWHLDIIGYRSLLKFPLAIVSDEEAPVSFMSFSVILSCIVQVLLSSCITLFCIAETEITQGHSALVCLPEWLGVNRLHRASPSHEFGLPVLMVIRVSGTWSVLGIYLKA